MRKVHFIKNEKERNFWIRTGQFNKLKDISFFVFSSTVICKRIVIAEDFCIVRPVGSYRNEEMIFYSSISFLFEIFCKTSCDAGFSCTRVAGENYERLGKEGADVTSK